ncbi:hypothetical protein DPSP01_006273 [Paraphaeosphaeria sporulosa]
MAPSFPFTFRVGTPNGLSFKPSMPAVAPRSTVGPRDDNFTGNHKLVIVLVVLAVIAGILLVIFSSRKAREQDRLAKERGAFLRGLQRRNNEPSMVAMAIPLRIKIIASSITLIVIIAITLATSLEIRAHEAPRQLIQISKAQLAKDGKLEAQVQAQAQQAGAAINGSAFDRGDILSGTSTVAADITAAWVITGRPTIIASDEGMIGATATAQPTSVDEGFIGNTVGTSKPTPSVRPLPPPAPQVPIVAMSYAGDGGPKHCRGQLLQKLNLPRPAKTWLNGTCVDLPGHARCGVFYSAKGDNCEAQLFTMEGCYNTTETYVNTVVFMPEERPVGAMWKSMFIRCGLDVPEPALIDPSILGGALKKPGGG